MARRTGAAELAAAVTENGQACEQHVGPAELVSLPLVRRWYVQVESLPSGRLQGQPFVFGTQLEAAEAIAQLEREHRAMGWSDRYDVVCWVE